MTETVAQRAWRHRHSPSIGASAAPPTKETHAMLPHPTPEQIEHAMTVITATPEGSPDPAAQRRAVFLLLSSRKPEPSLDIGWPATAPR